MMGRSPESTGPGMGWGLGMEGGATPVPPTRLWLGTDQQDPGAEAEAQVPQPGLMPPVSHSASPDSLPHLEMWMQTKMMILKRTSPPALTPRPVPAEHVTHMMFFNLCKNAKRLAGLTIILILQMRKLRPRDGRDSAIKCWSRGQTQAIGSSHFTDWIQ